MFSFTSVACVFIAILIADVSFILAFVVMTIAIVVGKVGNWGEMED